MSQLDRCVLAAREIPQDEPAIATLVAGLTADERALLSPRAVAKRRAEFAAGRAAAHEAIDRYLGQRGARAPHGLRVLREDGERRGRPFVVAGDPPATLSIEVSITHSGETALAVAAPFPLGLDLETVEPRADSFVAEALLDDELEAWSSVVEAPPDSPETITAAFAGKEAALKYLGTGMGLPLRRVVVQPSAPGESVMRLGDVAGKLFTATLAVDEPPGSARVVDLTGFLGKIDMQVLVLVCASERAPQPGAVARET